MTGQRIKTSRLIIVFLNLIIFSLNPFLLNYASGCTVAVISGKATPDGRPLLWKNRDASAVDNKIVFLKGPKYEFIGLINATDKKALSVWAGINTQGFAIINAASSDLADDEKGGAENGRFMRQALGECGSVADFERLLEATNGRRQVAANFGVIDAHGQACFFETGKDSFVKFDANDVRMAPFGYLVRTNYAFTAPEKFKGGGYIRFERISHLFEKALGEGRLNLEFILQEACRDLVNEKLHSFPLTQPLPSDPACPLYINTNDTINRNSTVAVTVFQGATNPAMSYLATMWVILGQPIASVAVPSWPSAKEIPSPLTGPSTSALNESAKRIIAFLYPDVRGHMPQYLNITRLRTYGGEGVLTRLLRIENEILQKTRVQVASWEKAKPAPEEMADFAQNLALWVMASLKTAFPDLLKEIQIN